VIIDYIIKAPSVSEQDWPSTVPLI
jgi:hypothetical protein